MEQYFYIFISIFIVSLVSLVGVFTLSVKEKTIKKILPSLVALSTGSLLGGFFIHILPRLAKENPNNFSSISIFILVGILIFYFTEKAFHWHHHHSESESKHCSNCEHINEKKKVKPVGYMILFSDAFHNFLDGTMIASTFLIDIKLGIITTILIILHELPQEIGDFGILFSAGFSRKKALLFNFLSSLTAFLGAIVVIGFSSILENLSVYLSAVAGGGFLYIALVDLIPEMHNHKHTKTSMTWEIFFLFMGLLIMFSIHFAKHYLI